MLNYVDKSHCHDGDFLQELIFSQKGGRHPHPPSSILYMDIRTRDTLNCKSAYLNNTHRLRVPFRLQLKHPQSER